MGPNKLCTADNMPEDWDDRGDDLSDLDFEESEFFQQVNQPFTKSGVRYVYLWNTGTSGDSFYYQIYLWARRVLGLRIIFRKKAYPLYAKGPEDTVPGYAIFVAEEDRGKLAMLANWAVDSQVRNSKRTTK